MSETFGTVVFPKTKLFSQITRENAYQLKGQLVEGLMDISNQDANRFKAGAFSINDILIRGEYVGITTFGDEWEGLVKAVFESGSSAEIYAALFTEYGGRYFYAKNKGSKLQYFFDEDGDEQFQEGFDQQANEAEYEALKKRWHEIANPFVVENFKPVVAFNPWTETFENQELKEVYTEQEYSMMVQAQLPDMIALLEADSEESRTEFLQKYVAQDDRELKRLTKSFSDILRQVVLICLKNVMGEKPLNVESENRVYYSVPIEQVSHLIPEMPEKIGFNWVDNRQAFLLYL